MEGNVDKRGDKVVHLHDAVDNVVAGKLIQPSAHKIGKEMSRVSLLFMLIIHLLNIF